VNLQMRWLAVVVLAGLISSAARADMTVIAVGDNGHIGFENTGGSGSMEGQGNGQVTILKTFTKLGDIPIIVSGGPLPVANGMDTLHVSERVTNNTGVPWTDFHYLAGLIDAASSLQIDFLNFANPTGEFTSSTPSFRALTLLGNVPDGHTFSVSFDLKVTGQPNSFYEYGIHETPSVPEPATISLAAGSLLGLMFLARRRK
jgi:PEP-CTERM motif